MISGLFWRPYAMKASWTLALTISVTYAQVELKVVATDHAGHPVTDLQPSDLRVIDDGSPQSITSLRLDQSPTAPAVVILLDLMDLSFQQRNAELNQMRESLAGAEATDRKSTRLNSSHLGISY